MQTKFNNMLQTKFVYHNQIYFITDIQGRQDRNHISISIDVEKIFYTLNILLQ